MIRILASFCFLLCLVVGCTDDDKEQYHKAAFRNRALSVDNQRMGREKEKIRTKLERERAALTQDRETLDALRREAESKGVPKVFTRHKVWNVVLVWFASVWLVLALIYYSILFYCLKVRARKRRGGR